MMAKEDGCSFSEWDGLQEGGLETGKFQQEAMATGKVQGKGDLNKGGKNFSYHMAEEHRKSIGLSDNWRQGSEGRQQGKKKKEATSILYNMGKIVNILE